MESVYESALFEIGSNGKFQKYFDVFYNFTFPILWTLAYCNIILVLTIIPHSCELPLKPSNVTEIYWKNKYIPIVEDSAGNLGHSYCLTYTNPHESNSTTGCKAYIYNKTWYESTIASVNNWVCDDEIYVANVFAYSRIGEAIGSILFGWFGDIYGRRLTYIISLSLLLIGRLISIIGSHSFVIFVIGCIISCLPSWSAVQSAIVISMEISAPERRSITATLRTIAFSAGMSILPLLYWWLREWKSFMIITTLAPLPFFLLSWKLIESPRWLWLRNETEYSIEQLQKIANVNHSKLKDDTMDLIRTTPPPKEDQVLGPLSLFSGWVLAKNTSLQLYLWLAVSLSYMVLILSIGSKTDGNPFLDFAWQSFIEIPGTFIGTWLADSLGRRYTGALSYFLSSLMWILHIIKEIGKVTWLQNWWVGWIAVIFNRLCITVAYYAIYLCNMELYPTCLRQSGMALGNVFSSGACAFAAYLIYVGHNIDAKIPGVTLVIVSIGGLVASLLLPETLNTKLPETLSDAQNVGKDNPKYTIVPTNKNETLCKVND
ncbi:hypothetical protein ACJJTC_006552 [Scirpophaga incertulas]